jgi:hypothetical protein
MNVTTACRIYAWIFDFLLAAFLSAVGLIILAVALVQWGDLDVGSHPYLRFVCATATTSLSIAWFGFVGKLIVSRKKRRAQRFGR